MPRCQAKQRSLLISLASKQLRGRVAVRQELAQFTERTIDLMAQEKAQLLVTRHAASDPHTTHKLARSTKASHKHVHIWRGKRGCAELRLALPSQERYRSESAGEKKSKR